MVLSLGTPHSSAILALYVARWDQYTRCFSLNGPPTSLYTGTPCELALDVPQGKLDAGDSHCGSAAGRRARVAVHVHPELIDRERVFTYQRLSDVLDERGQALCERAPTPYSE